MINLHKEFLATRQEIEAFLNEHIDTVVYFRISRLYETKGETLAGCKMIMTLIERMGD